MTGSLSILALSIGFLGLLMGIPAGYAAATEDWATGRSFLYCGLLVLLLAAALAIVLRPIRGARSAQRELETLLLIWCVVPVCAALPVAITVPVLGPVGAWFETVAAFTTTGGGNSDRLASINDSVHLWRGVLGWYGGLVTLTAAYVVMAPRRLGGYEVFALSAEDMRGLDADRGWYGATVSQRLLRAANTVLPYYLGLTAAVAVAMKALGENPLSSVVHAMALVSTSGISADAGGLASAQSWGVEIVAVFAMLAAASRSVMGLITGGRRVRHDPEVRLLLQLVTIATLLLLGRTLFGALTVSADVPMAEMAAAFWGTAFTALSFLTTTGFQSAWWETSQTVSGLTNPDLILLGLCMIGGGAATTAGGIKLIRAHALLQHGARELERIASPNSVAGVRRGGRTLRRDGAMIAWTFMMLFIAALMLAVLGLTLTGLVFEDALVAAVAALANTGPAYAAISQSGLNFAEFDAAQQIILGATMILGRIEVIVFIAIFNAEGLIDLLRGRKRTGNSAAPPSF